MLLVFHSQIKGAQFWTVPPTSIFFISSRPLNLLYGRLVSLLKLKSISTMVFLTALNVLGPVHLRYFSLSRCHFAIELSHCFSRLRTSSQQFSYASLQHLKARPSLRQRVPNQAGSLFSSPCHWPPTNSTGRRIRPLPPEQEPRSPQQPRESC